MGLFGSRKKTYVSSAIYNMAGDIDKRTNFLKNTVLSNILLDRKKSIGQTITDAYIRGPGVKFQAFLSWAIGSSGYSNYIRMSQAKLAVNTSIDTNVIATQMNVAIGEPVTIQTAEIGAPDFSYWAEQYMLEYYPNEFDSDWIADFNDKTKLITVDRADNKGQVQVGAPTFISTSRYLYVSYVGSSGKLKIWIYRYGTGNAALDALFVTTTADGELFPFIPVRIDNKFISDSYLRDIYALSKKAYKKATGADFDELVDKIADNESLKDIDYAYVNFGVSLNTKETVGKKYLYKFFKMILDQTGSANLATFQNQQVTAESSNATMRAWGAAQSNPSSPLYGTTKPSVTAYPALPMTSMVVTSGRPDMNYSMTTRWNKISEATGSGLLKPGAKKGDLWLQKRNAALTYNSLFLNALDISNSVDAIQICWQDDDNHWRMLDITGLEHINTIYKGKSVEITGSEALADDEESGFMVPLHESVLNAMSLKDKTQLSTSCAYVTFNCYKVVKKKWYQTGIFTVIVIVAIIVVAYFFPPAGASAGGILGTNAAVGTAVGLSGTAALIAGAAVNAIAAMIVVQLVTKVSTEIFGDKIGAIVGAIAGVVTLQVGTAMAQGASMATAFSGLMNPTSILAMTNAVGQGYAGYMQAATAEVVGKTEKILTEYQDALEDISSKMQELYGTDGLVNFDPMQLMDAANSSAGSETRTQFLTRTLLTGSDVADMSIGMISQFADLTLNVDLPS